VEGTQHETGCAQYTNNNKHRPNEEVSVDAALRLLQDGTQVVARHFAKGLAEQHLYKERGYVGDMNDALVRGSDACLQFTGTFHFSGKM
jgi:hypothetical protein